MPMTGAQIRQDKSFDLLTEAILERDQPRTADLFHRMVARDGRSVGDALSVVTAAEAPFVQVPSHINVRDGQISLINNDHTILGLRTSAHLAPFVPEKYRLLPLLQSVWYIPAGLDIWNQLLGKYPGRYATMKGMDVPPPSYGPAVWNQEQEPIIPEGTVEEKLHQHLVATVSGDVRRSYGLFLGLAADESMRPLLRDQLFFLGLIDLQDTVAGRKARNTGHKALRARAIADLADFIGWERAHGVYYVGVPDMAIGPLYYSIYDAACVTVTNEFPEAGKQLARANSHAAHPGRGGGDGPAPHGGRRGDGVEPDHRAPAQRPVHPESRRRHPDRRGGAHSSDHGAAAVHGRPAPLRLLQHGQLLDAAEREPYRPRLLYLMAHFVNDVARSNKLFTSVIEGECAGFDGAGRTPASLLEELDEAILAYDVPRTTAVANAYLKSGADRRAYMTAVAVTACKFQDDPHNQKITHSTFEEYGANSTHLRDRLLLTSPAAPGRLAEDAGRARLLRALHAGVDERLRPRRPPSSSRGRG